MYDCVYDKRNMMRFWLFLFFLSVASAEELSIFAVELNDSGSPMLLGKFDYDIKSRNATVIQLNKPSIKSKGPYCVSAQLENDSNKDMSCFSMMNLKTPLHYDLLFDMHDDKIHKLSLVANEESDGIQPVIRNPVEGHKAPAIQLKKTTKTYKDKKLNENGSPTQIEEDTVPLEGNWFESNWKILVIGIILVNLVASGAKKTDEDNKKRD